MSVPLEGCDEALLRASERGVEFMMGIDEAGRGPTLGPMVYGSAFCAVEDESRLKAMGFMDSKQLTEAKRDHLWAELQSSGFIGWQIRVLHAKEISEGMLRKHAKYNLNAMSHDAAIGLVRKVLDRGINLRYLYVDTVGDPVRYQAKLADPDVAAFMVEPIQGEAGIVVPQEGYMAKVKALCQKHNVLLIADEVQTGFGRVGTHMWAFEPQGVVPDIVTVGKPFGNGFPLAAVITNTDVVQASNNFEYFNTFGGNPVCTAAGLAVLTLLEREGLREHAAAVGLTLRRLLARLAASQDGALIGYHP